MVQFEAKLTLPEIGYVRPKQVSYIMGVSRATLYNWIKAGKTGGPYGRMACRGHPGKDKLWRASCLSLSR